MYKLMLVDDESEIREGLNEVIDFASFGFTVAGEAENGLEAVQLAERIKPDLVITDIKMPLLDGLSMCRQVQKLLPTTCFIILSGYDDFEYARRAITLNCLGYMLKPISADEFREMLKKAKAKLDEEFAQRRDLVSLREHYEKSLPLLKEMMLSALLSGSISAEDARASAARYGLPLEAKQYVLAMLSVQPSEESKRIIADPELLTVAAQNILSECFAPRATAYYVHEHGALYILILLKEEGEDAFSQSLAWINEARQTVDYYLKTRVFIGVSAPAMRLEGLRNAARQAQSTLEQGLAWDDERMLCVTDLEPGVKGELLINEVKLRSLGNALKIGGVPEITRALDEVFTDCRESKPSPKAYRAYLLEIYMTLLRTARDMSIELEAQGENKLGQLVACPPPEAAYQILSAMCGRFSASVRENRATFSRMLSKEAMDYMSDHFVDEELTIEKLCAQLHISPSYFSVLFKKETKKTFVQALTEIRMDKAMTLLTGSEMKTAQIAQAVGVPDPSYFSYSFKKHFGFSPSQARKQGELKK